MPRLPRLDVSTLPPIQGPDGIILVRSVFSYAQWKRCSHMCQNDTYLVILLWNRQTYLSTNIYVFFAVDDLLAFLLRLESYTVQLLADPHSRWGWTDEYD